MNIWVVKCSDQRPDGARWRWQSYFHGVEEKRPAEIPYPFGGDKWIRNPASRQRIRDAIAPGDLVVCYYTKRREIHGLTRLHSAGREEREGSGRFTRFDLAPADEAFPFDPPLRVVEDLYRHNIHPACFRPGTRGTLCPVGRRDFASIVKAFRRRSPGQAEAIAEWLAWAGWQQGTAHTRSGKVPGHLPKPE
jgi:hypothetical protein